MPTFKHSGDLGDIIYSLPTVRALGGGMFYLNATNGAMTKMTNTGAEAVAALIQTQEYITGVQIWHGQPVDYDLDTFRYCPQGGPVNLSFRNLADVHLAKFGLPVKERDTPWLKPDKTQPCDILISRSKRYHNKWFDWKKLITCHRGRDIRFIGLKDEYEAFCNGIGEIVPYQRTANFLEIARYMAGCNIFYGNQSSPLAVAIGLGIAAEIEVDPRNPNCRYYRPNVRHYYIFPEINNCYTLVRNSSAT